MYFPDTDKSTTVDPKRHSGLWTSPTGPPSMTKDNCGQRSWNSCKKETWLTTLKMVCDRVVANTIGQSSVKGGSLLFLSDRLFSLSRARLILISKSRFTFHMQASYKNSQITRA